MRLLAECISQKGSISCGLQETASHCPFQDHELSMSRHIPKWEHLGQGGQEPPLGTEPEIVWEGRGDVDPLTPTMGAVGEKGRTPVPVAESTRHPGERPLTPATKHKREGQIQRVNLQLLHRVREGPLERLKVTIGEANLNGHCLNPQTRVDLRRGGTGKEEVPLRDTQRWG